MKTIKYFREGGTEPEIFACGECGVHWAAGEHKYLAKGGEAIADGCCTPGVCVECGRDDLHQYHTLCGDCREVALFRRAKKVTAEEFGDCAVWAELDDFYGSVGEYIEYCQDAGITPAYVWAASQELVCLDPSEVVDSARDGIFDVELSGEGELRKFIAKWNLAQTGTIWRSETNVAVLLDWELHRKPPSRGNPPGRIAARNNAKTRISLERDRQIELWGDGPLPMDIRLAVLVEEVGEVAKAMQDEGDARVLEELVQVGAVALRWAEDLLLEMDR